MKRLVLLCDGTWLGGDGARSGNVVQLARAILARSAEGIEQITFYHEGQGNGFFSGFDFGLAVSGVVYKIRFCRRYNGTREADCEEEGYCFFYAEHVGSSEGCTPEFHATGGEEHPTIDGGIGCQDE